MMFLNLIKINLISLLIFSCLNADIIKEIKVSGNKRLSDESIIIFGNIELNKNYNNDNLNLILKDLYSTNFFENVKLDIDNEILVISVTENPIIEELIINGIKNKSLKEFILENIKLKDRQSYNESIFLTDLNLVKNIIQQNGYYFSNVKTSLVKDDVKNSIQLTYNIDLGDRAKIDKIIFNGDKKIKDRKLLNVIATEPNKFWKFLSKNVYLDKKRIDLDNRLLKNYYKNLGYYNSVISNSFIELQSDNSFKLTFNIDAGEKFYFNNLKLEIPNDYDPKYFISINKILSKNKGSLYSLEKINKILVEIDKIALSKQYQFVNADFKENVTGNKIDILISLLDSEKVYIERINVLGNQFTEEDVIRNSFVIDEGDAFNEILFNKTINRLKAKGLFASVNSKIVNGSNKGLKSIDIIVEEKPTGEISLGAGLGTTGGTIGGGIKENNFLGKGIMLDTNISISENTIKGKFVYAKPNFNYSDNTLFTSLESSTTDNLADYGYKTSNFGFSLGTTFQQYEDLYFSPELSANLETLEASSTASSKLKKQKGDYTDIYFNYSLNQDLRNQPYQPTEGFRNNFRQELPLISDNYEIINSFDTAFYKKLGTESVGKISFYTKAVNTLNNEDVRISKRLNLPSTKLRGFEQGKIGPKDNADYIGGNYVSSINFAATIPQLLPSFQTFDFSYFIDAGNVWGVDYDSSLDESSTIRSSTGLSVDVITPIGPMNFAFSKPLTKASSDKTESFRFNIGTTF